MWQREQRVGSGFLGQKAEASKPKQIINAERRKRIQHLHFPPFERETFAADSVRKKSASVREANAGPLTQTI